MKRNSSEKLNYLGNDEPMTIGAKSNDIVAPLRAVDANFFPTKKIEHLLENRNFFDLGYIR
jgi:hypothetical protein